MRPRTTNCLKDFLPNYGIRVTTIRTGMTAIESMTTLRSRVKTGTCNRVKRTVRKLRT
jgi:hypothetical protein